MQLVSFYCQQFSHGAPNLWLFAVNFTRQHVCDHPLSIVVYLVPVNLLIELLNNICLASMKFQWILNQVENTKLFEYKYWVLPFMCTSEYFKMSTRTWVHLSWWRWASVVINKASANCRLCIILTKLYTILMVLTDSTMVKSLHWKPTHQGSNQTHTCVYRIFFLGVAPLLFVPHVTSDVAKQTAHFMRMNK